jgi:hypothetical protein
MTTYINLTEDEFLARFKPVPNHIDPNRGFDGCLFETFGDEFAYVQAQDPNLVWTVLDGDGQLSIASGFHFVNRLGYLVASVPVPPDHTCSVACEDLAEPDDDMRLRLAAGDLLAALEQAVQALNTAPRFRVPHLGTDSYKIAATCDRAIAKAKGGAP